MKAIVVRAFGGPEALGIEEAELPSPGAGEALVAVSAAGVNFMDTGTRRGLTPGKSAPVVPGVEGAGTVLAVGPGVVDIRPGDRVAWYFAWGSYAEQLIAPADQLVPLPDDLSFEDGAGIMMQGLTASNLVFESHPVKPGDVALVHAASGGVGLLLTQMIKLLGGEVIARVSSEAKVALAREAGADHVLVGRGDEIGDKVLAITAGRGVDVVYDGTGAESFRTSLDLVDYHGTLALFGPLMEPLPPIDPFSIPKSIKITYPVVMHHVRNRDALLARSRQLFDWMRSGQLRLHVGQSYPLAAAADAHRDIESRRSTGKLLLKP
ncbi:MULTISPECIES: quinone oxidoreductase [unclassified Sphingopyxis]|uniref:quinone oxidoreductase family protein n=1 Tax=unclassified Sphingopyxis TaxID=2614943 RepID=UPI000730F695|nr:MULTISPECIES: quinone oxidoreductase [unclassified Sphingopyxis]KTE25752.1 alcohol dehydrogenase [Sphingopyxis sp. H057]KTE51433.1 alcohol dehydrogenase [Sphingopyxis sp. H073]KTE54068.1 alcohol dehydrogenase [Sphingopyxis sp. H071]KTE57149.1 alcohol dehydrogenase [Sphingopyxis sp. H107]KTE61805.1 alcohol dehydrogenase [Sphingopyxis sp. H100]